MMKRFILLTFLALTLTQCAVSYKPIKPETVVFEAVDENDDLRFAYKYDVLGSSGNRKLAKYEKRSGIRVLAVSITNKTQRPLEFERDLDLYTEEEYPYLSGPESTIKTFSQPVAPYLLYGLLFYAKFDCDGRGLNCAPTNIIPFGVAIAVVNMIIANKANKAMRKEFQQYSIIHRAIAPGETVHAILALEMEDSRNLPIKLEVREDPQR